MTTNQTEDANDEVTSTLTFTLVQVFLFFYDWTFSSCVLQFEDAVEALESDDQPKSWYTFIIQLGN